MLSPDKVNLLLLLKIVLLLLLLFHIYHRKFRYQKEHQKRWLY